MAGEDDKKNEDGAWLQDLLTQMQTWKSNVKNNFVSWLREMCKKWLPRLGAGPKTMAVVDGLIGQVEEVMPQIQELQAGLGDDGHKPQEVPLSDLENTGIGTLTSLSNLFNSDQALSQNLISLRDIMNPAFKLGTDDGDGETWEVGIEGEEIISMRDSFKTSASLLEDQAFKSAVAQVFTQVSDPNQQLKTIVALSQARQLQHNEYLANQGGSGDGNPAPGSNGQA